MGMAFSTGLGIIGQVSDYNNKMEQADAQTRQVSSQMNYQFQDYEIERQDAFDFAVNEIAKTHFKAQATQATASTAIGEGISGRTAGLLQRSVDSREASAVENIRSNYASKSNEIDMNKEATLKSSQNYVKHIKRPNELGLYAGIASSILSANNKMKNAKADAELKDVKFNESDWWWKGSGVTS